MNEHTPTAGDPIPTANEPASTAIPSSPTAHDPTPTADLAAAARLAGLAPSIHNTQPWRWRVLGSTMQLWAVRERQLPLTDPLGRMLTISCGAALHHARVALAAEGWQAAIHRLPDPAQPDLLAEVTVRHRVAVTPEALRLLQTARVRRTDRRPVTDTPVDPEAIAHLCRVAEREGARLHVLGRDEVIELAGAASLAQQVEGRDPAWAEELAYWAGGERRHGLGVPDATIPSQPPPTTVPDRDFGPTGTLPIWPGRDRAAVYALLYGDEDTGPAWLRAGEALSAVWLEAMLRGLTVLPLSAVIEVAQTRAVLHRMLAGLGEPFLVLRLGVGDADHVVPPHSPRLPAEQTVEIVS
jgi:nitroreductase